jgi:hypothetical protein
VRVKGGGGCVWTYQSDEYSDVWETECGKSYVFEDGTPLENEHRFCGWCGKPIKEKKSR